MLFNTYELAATLLVGVDVFRNERKRSSSRPRVMTGIACVGSTAINDFEVDVYIEDFYVGRFRNTRAGAAVQVIASEDIYPTGNRLIPAGSQVSGIIANAAVANPVIIQVHGTEL